MRTTHYRRGLYAPELLEARIAPATFTVTSLLDNGGEGTLRKEIADADLLPGADTIVFKIPAADLPGTILLGSEILIKDTLTIKGPGVDLLSVSGQDLYRIFNIGDGTAALKPTAISGLTLTDGNTAASGGALFSSEPLSLKNVVVRSSYSAGYGGGAYVTTDGKISVVSSRFVHNGADDNGGGAVLNGKAGVTVIKSTFADNTSSFAAGLYASAGGARSTVLIDTCVISNNVAASVKGGLGLRGMDDGRLIVKNSLITGNNGGDLAGGLFLNSGNLAITNTTFSANQARVGGALVDDAAKSLTISGSLFLGNRATDGAGAGGGALQFEGASTVKISGTVFSGNFSSRNGGAIANHGAGLTLGIAGSSFLGNTASFDAGAISLNDGAVLTVKSSLFNGNIGQSVGGAIVANFASVLNLSGSKLIGNRSANGGVIYLAGAGVDGATANLSGNLFQSNFSSGNGGAITAIENSHFTSKTDRFIGNVAMGAGGGVDFVTTGGISITGSLFQSNVAGGSGGGADIGGAATLTGLKVIENISGPGGKGGGLRLSGGPIVVAKSIVTGNVANDGGGIFFNAGTTTLDPETIAKTKGNAAVVNQNVGTA